MFMMFAQVPVRKPICPTFVHDPQTRTTICVVSVVVGIYAFYRIMRYFNQ